MIPLRKRLELAREKCGLRLGILQQDYILSWILVGLFEHSLLKSGLIFKGGTALKKCYFGEYRFSEDLDFSVTAHCPKGELLLKAIIESCQTAEHRINTFAPIRLLVERYEEKDPHPHEQEAFTIRAQFPWEREPLTVVMIEVSHQEILLLPSVMKKIIHEYGEPMDTEVVAYPLEEIVLEKFRAILQRTKKLHENNWDRSRIRDYYDLWRIFGSFEGDLSFDDFVSLLQQKCSFKQVGFSGAESFFDPRMINNVLNTWQKWLGPLVPQLPPCNQVLDELKVKIESLLKSHSLLS